VLGLGLRLGLVIKPHFRKVSVMCGVCSVNRSSGQSTDELYSMTGMRTVVVNLA